MTTDWEVTDLEVRAHGLNVCGEQVFDRVVENLNREYGLSPGEFVFYSARWAFRWAHVFLDLRLVWTWNHIPTGFSAESNMKLDLQDHRYVGGPSCPAPTQIP